MSAGFGVLALIGAAPGDSSASRCWLLLVAYGIAALTGIPHRLAAGGQATVDHQSKLPG
jgi:hypothetical protein